ncbi:helix-turn-helix transcriptional regulator [Rhizobiales bacterium]|uniref:helix-turn-helix domain-containing protein n=1 Tax=Hongsoonwoonella zoysiae TaxID=2821844 RepID=UPI00155F7A2E|nr:helix-turn-helix transcriptional regulator [Hongsoonwoonella zoysiae]NRG16903.1 helix-turn-helix transcriptional regulator [Hongsoonwoonella zoysiae]
MNDSIQKRSNSIGVRLKEARKLAGLSQGQVANMLGLHRPSVSEIESGNRRVSAEELHRLCDIYDVSLDWVVGKASGSISPDDPRLELAARELSKLNPDDLNRLLHVIAAMRSDKDSGEGNT